MGFVFTKYGAGKNGGEIQFDVDKFDYYYTDVDEWAETPSDYIQIESEVGDVYTMLQSSVELDSMGTLKDVDDGDEILFPGIIQPITKKDREIHEMGLAVPGNSKLFTRPKFTVTCAGTDIDYILNAGDIFIDKKGIKWRVEKTPKEWIVSRNEVYNIHIIKNIGLKQGI